MASTYTCDGSITAYGAYDQARAYKKLLFNLCETGLTLKAIKITPRVLQPTLIEFTVEGSNEQIAHLRRLVNDG